MDKNEKDFEIQRINSLIATLEHSRLRIEEELQQLKEEHSILNNEVDGDDDEVLPDLIVLRGETRTLTQRTYKYNKLIVEEGANLVIRGSARKWCIVHCENEVIINGTITGNGIPIGSMLIESITPSGMDLSHIFNNTARGGNGGMGGPAHHWNNKRAEGGTGAAGTELYGGGGGGAGATLSRRTNRPAAYPGGNANGQAGGVPGQLGYAYGGDGGNPNRFGNGMLLYIHGESFEGRGGVINLRGKDGENGRNGDNGSYQRNGWFSTGAGGGGGGAPGVLIVESKTIGKYPRVNLEGGTGGSGGAGGSGSRPPGQAGRNGDDGEGGYVDWIIG